MSIAASMPYAQCSSSSDRHHVVPAVRRPSVAHRVIYLVTGKCSPGGPVLELCLTNNPLIDDTNYLPDQRPWAAAAFSAAAGSR